MASGGESATALDDLINLVLDPFIKDILEQEGLPRPGRIDMIGHGRQGSRLTDRLLLDMARSEDIRQLRIWVPGRGRLAGYAKIRAQRVLDDNKHVLTSHFGPYGKRLFTSDFEIRSYDELAELEEIVGDSNNNSLLIMAQNYSLDALAGPLRESRRAALQLGLDPDASDNDARQYAKTLLAERKAVTEFIEDHTGGPLEGRLKLLPDNFPAIKRLGGTLRGYRGSVLNFVNDVNVTTHLFASASDIPVDRITSPAHNDQLRYVEKLMNVLADERYVKQSVTDGGKMKEPALGGGWVFGPHAPQARIDAKNLLIDGEPFHSFFNEDGANVLALLEEHMSSYGDAYRKKHSVTAPDSALAALYPAVVSVIGGHRTPTRALTYEPRIGTFLGVPTEFVDGRAYLRMDLLSEQAQAGLLSSSMEYIDLVRAMEEDGLISKLEDTREDPRKAMRDEYLSTMKERLAKEHQTARMMRRVAERTKEHVEVTVLKQYEEDFATMRAQVDSLIEEREARTSEERAHQALIDFSLAGLTNAFVSRSSLDSNALVRYQLRGGALPKPQRFRCELPDNPFENRSTGIIDFHPGAHPVALVRYKSSDDFTWNQRLFVFDEETHIGESLPGERFSVVTRVDDAIGLYELRGQGVRLHYYSPGRGIVDVKDIPGRPLDHAGMVYFKEGRLFREDQEVASVPQLSAPLTLQDDFLLYLSAGGVHALDIASGRTHEYPCATGLASYANGEQASLVTGSKDGNLRIHVFSDKNAMIEGEPSKVLETAYKKDSRVKAIMSGNQSLHYIFGADGTYWLGHDMERSHLEPIPMDELTPSKVVME